MDQKNINAKFIEKTRSLIASVKNKIVSAAGEFFAPNTATYAFS